MSRFYLALVFAVCFTLTACGSGGGTRQAALEVHSDSAPAAGLPALAELPLPLHKGTPDRTGQASGVYSFGQGDMVSSAGAVMTGPLLVLDGSAPYSYAVFAYDLQGGTVGQLHVGGSGNLLYLAAADYSAGLWEWLDGPLGAPGDYDLPAAHSSPGGLVYIALVCAAGGNAHCTISLDYTNDVPTWDGTWNLLVWIAGDNNLAYEGFADIQEMEAVGSSENIRVLCGYDIDPAYLDPAATGADQVHFIKVVPDSDPNAINVGGDPANQSFPRAGYDSADPAHLAEFVQWAADNFPADHIILDLWDHGDGWHRSTSGVVDGNAGKDARPRYPVKRLAKMGLLEGRHSSGILGDDTDSGTYYLTANDEIVGALSAFHFDMLLFDACNMANVEALFDFRSLCDWMTASECLVPSEGFDYTGALSAWTAGFPLPPEEVGQQFCNTQIAYYAAQDMDVAMGVFSSTEAGSLADSLRAFATAVTAGGAAEHDAVVGAIEAAYEPYGGDGERDLKTFLSSYAGLTPTPSLAQAAQTALGNFTSTVNHFTQNLFPEANGISVWLPSSDFYGWYLGEYQGTPFDIYTGWSAMLDATGASTGPTLQTSDWQPGDWIELSWADSNNDIDLYITDPSGYNSGPYYESGTPNLSFSAESTVSGQAAEWAELKPAAAGGPYLVQASRWDELASGVDVSIRLYDSSDVLKQDFGIVTLSPYDMQEVVMLAFDGTLLVADWSPGDRIEIDWGDPLADVDLGTIDPQGYYSSPFYGSQTANLLFSPDSYDSGLSLEYARLKPKAIGGAYFIGFENYSGEPSLSISAKIYDGQDALKQDLGSFMVPVDTFDTYLRLNYTPPPQ